mgnify:CR=1 FL=1
MSDELKHAAVAYAERGWRVFPVAWVRDDGACSCGDADCKSPAKHPLTSHGLKDASSDAQQVARWWREKPRANIGIRTGAESGLVVLDVDPPEGEEQLARIEAHHGPIPPTLTARSGKGGQHFYFAHPGRPVSNRQDVLGERTAKEMGAIDVRGDGGYIIAPPSRNAAGAYEWTAPDETPPAHIPDYLFPVIENRSDLRKRKSADAPPASEPTNGKGSHDTARDLAWALVHGMRDFAEIARVVDAVNAKAAQLGARRMDSHEIERLVTGALAKQSTDGTPERKPVLDELWRTVGEWGDAGSGDWLTTRPPPASYLLTRPDDKGNERGAVPLGRVGMLAAAGGVGKSWVLCQLALSVATGTMWLSTFKVPKPGRVLLALAEEEAEEMQRRLYYGARALGLSSTQQAEARSRIVALPLAGKGVALTYSADELRAMPEQQRPRPGELLETPFAEELRTRLKAADDWRLIVLDPMSRFAGPDVEVDNAQATRFVQTLEKLTHVPGPPTVIVAHHTTKGSRAYATAGASSVDARGASALSDGVRWQGGLAPCADVPDYVWFEVTKGNYTKQQAALLLKRGEHGELRTPTPSEYRDEYQAAKEAAKPDGQQKRPKGKKPEKDDRKAAAAGRDAADKLGLT